MGIVIVVMIMLHSTPANKFYSNVADCMVPHASENPYSIVLFQLRFPDFTVRERQSPSVNAEQAVG